MSKFVQPAGPPTEEEIELAFIGTNFGNTDHISLVKNGLLKCASGHYNDATLSVILRELGLTVTKFGQRQDYQALTLRGQHALYEWFCTDRTV
jgi:hypothetical protein